MQNPHRWLCLVFVSGSLFDQDQGFSQQLRIRKSRFNKKRKPNFSLVALQWRDIKLSGKLLVVKSRKCDCFSRRKSIQFVRVFNMNTIIHVFSEGSKISFVLVLYFSCMPLQCCWYWPLDWENSGLLMKSAISVTFLVNSTFHLLQSIPHSIGDHAVMRRVSVYGSL